MGDKTVAYLNRSHKMVVKRLLLINLSVKVVAFCTSNGICTCFLPNEMPGEGDLLERKM